MINLQIALSLFSLFYVKYHTFGSWLNPNHSTSNGIWNWNHKCKLPDKKHDSTSLWQDMFLEIKSVKFRYKINAY